MAEHGEAAKKLADHWEREARRQAAFAAAAGSAELEAELQELRTRVVSLSKDLIALESTVTLPNNSFVLQLALPLTLPERLTLSCLAHMNYYNAGNL